MTVRQIGKQTFNVPKGIVTEHTERILRMSRVYRRVHAHNNGVEFLTNIKPNFLLLGTDMVVALQDVDSSTLVTVTMRSQPFIIGDAFGLYFRYVQGFLAALKQELSSNQQIPIVASAIEYKMESDWIPVVLLLLFEIILFTFTTLLAQSSMVFLVGTLVVAILVASFVRLFRGGRLFR